MQRCINRLTIHCLNNEGDPDNLFVECGWLGKLSDWETHSVNGCQCRMDVDQSIKFDHPETFFCATIRQMIDFSLSNSQDGSSVIVNKDQVLMMNERNVMLLKEGDFVINARNTFINSSTVKFCGKDHKVAEVEIQQLLHKGCVTITFQKGHLRRRLDRLIENNDQIQKAFADKANSATRARESYYKNLLQKKQDEISRLQLKAGTDMSQEEEKKPAALNNDELNTGDCVSGKRCANQISGNIYLNVHQLKLERKELKGGS